MPDKHSPITQAFHWLIAGALVVQIPLAYIMIAQPISPDKFGNYALHKSIGLAIFAATVLRLTWRLVSKRHYQPALTARLRRLSQLSHGGLYLITISMPLTGWLSSSAANFPVSFFGWFTLPDLVEPSKALHEQLELTHRWLAYALFGVLSAHISAALYHHFGLRDGVMAAMIPFLRQSK